MVRYTHAAPETPPALRSHQAGFSREDYLWPDDPEARFCHLGFYQLFTADIANEYNRIVIDKLAAVFVQRILPAVFYFGVNRSYPWLVVSTLGNAQFRFQGAVFTTSDPIAIAVRRRIFTAKINAYGTCASACCGFVTDYNIEIPTPPGIFIEAARPESILR